MLNGNECDVQCVHVMVLHNVPVSTWARLNRGTRSHRRLQGQRLLQTVSSCLRLTWVAIALFQFITCKRELRINDWTRRRNARIATAGALRQQHEHWKACKFVDPFARRNELPQTSNFNLFYIRLLPTLCCVGREVPTFLWDCCNHLNRLSDLLIHYRRRMYPNIYKAKFESSWKRSLGISLPK